ncbi:hypothetical protein [Tepidibacter hydrothermalis]|uniref:DNA helicase n=1 Tax=Tepidibacter hydrothermalis TaxID=3036126 RepID=A0ABY8EBP8_9FIRM|nr:hypothetical protein [Tepidibacter hydrothermalis]WFD09209.1 hypothetical protein P4S50_12530 [Tepidibacter hydrothermalis]
MGKYVYTGSSNTGKTTKLVSIYKEFIKNNVDENRIIIFINSKSQKKFWDGIDTSTFYKIIRNHIVLFWPLVQKNIKIKKTAPKFLDMEISEYLLNKLVDKYREGGRFLDVNIPNSVLSSDILNNISKISLNCIEFDDVDKYLINFLDIEDIFAKENISSMKNIINVFVRKNISEGVLNFSLASYLFNKYIIDDPLYENYIKNNIDCFIVDDIQEKSFLELKFINKVMNIVNETHIAYNSDGAITKILGADEESFKQLILPKCEKIDMGTSDFINIKNVEFKNSTMRSEMILKISEEIQNLLKSGYKEEDIDIIGPFVDSIFENRIKKEMEKNDVNINIMTRSGSLTDNPYINSLVTITLLVNSSWKMSPNKDSICKMISFVLGADMIRSRYITDKITQKEPYELPEIEELTSIDIDEEYINKYKILRNWIYENTNSELDMDKFLKKMFLDILLPLDVSAENLSTCNYLINLAKSFIDYANENEKFKDNKNKLFIDMILKGIRVSDMKADTQLNGIKVWSSYSYLLSSKSSKIQIWTDSSSDVWHQIGIKKYYNPFIFLRENKGEKWNFDNDELYRYKQTKSVVESLLRKASDKVYIYSSEFNSNGYEQKGELSKYISKIDT